MHDRFPKRLKQLRIKEGLTQAKLASSLGIAKSTVSMYEVGKREPDFEMTEAIADFFNVDLNYLMGTVDDPYDYETDPDARLAEIPTMQFNQLADIYHGDPKSMWDAWTSMSDATAEDVAQERNLTSQAIVEFSRLGFEYSHRSGDDLYFYDRRAASLAHKVSVSKISALLAKKPNMTLRDAILDICLNDWNDGTRVAYGYMMASQRDQDLIDRILEDNERG